MLSSPCRLPTTVAGLVFWVATSIAPTASAAGGPPAAAEPAPAMAFAPSSLKLTRGTINEVMVLGSSHLSQLPKPFDVAQLRLLNQRLVQWRPQAIAIESLSGVQCANLRRYPQRYADTVKMYCRDTSAAQAATGLDVWAATEQAERMLADWPDAPGAARRRTLASLLLAAGEPASALVQWLRLPVPERRAGDGLDTTLVAALSQLQARVDEGYLIAAQVAAESGLERVYAMDDHTADSVSGDEAAYGAAIMAAWDNPAGVARKRADAALQGQLGTPEGLLAMYRGDNDPGQAQQVFDSDFGAALEEPSAARHGRNYVAYWETRNLRMASNIREAMSPPGVRMLVIVGASHKFYLEAYLNQMHDVRIISTDAVLR